MLIKVITSSGYIASTKFFSNISMRNNSMILYGDEASPPVRFVQMTAFLLNVPYDMKKIDLFKSENRSVAYQKINQLQKVPALSVGNRVITDSHAIALYLCENFGGHSLYPEDSEIRSTIQQMLFFNCSTLFPIDSAIFTNFFALNKSTDEKLETDWTRALDYLEYQLGKRKWLADDKVTLCDLCCGATVSSLQLLIPPSENHKNVNDWMARLKELPCFEINERGLQRLRGFIQGVKQTTQ